MIKNTISSNSNVNPDDVLTLKKSMKQLGIYKSTGEEEELNEYPTQEMFDGIKKFQKVNNLKVDGVVKPNGETITAMREKMSKNIKKYGAYASPLDAGAQSIKTINSINDYYLAKKHIATAEKNAPQGKTVNDKYKHAYISAKVSQNGLLPASGIGIAGLGKELYQQYKKTNSPQESIDDMKANITGIYRGFTNSTGNADKMVRKSIPLYRNK